MNDRTGMHDDEQPIPLRRRAAAPTPTPTPAAPPPRDEPPPVDDEDDFYRRMGDEGEERRGSQPLPRKRKRDSIAEKNLPSNVEAEAALLGALMIDNRLIGDIRQRVSVEHFYEPVHARIFEAIGAMIDAGQAATPVTLVPRFRNDPAILELGGPGYLAQLTGSGAALIGARSFADQVKELAALRTTLHLFDRVEEIAVEDPGFDPAAKVLDLLTQAVVELTPVPRVRTATTIQDALDETWADLEDVAAGKSEGGFTIAGYQDWNDVVGPLNDGDLLYLGGRPSMGKTGISVAVALGAAAKMVDEQEDPGAIEFFSLEMSKKALTQRAIAQLIYQPGKTSSFTDLLRGRFTSIDRRAVAKAKAEIAAFPMVLHDPQGSALYVEDFAGELMKRKAYWERRGRRLKMVVVDYLDRFASRKDFGNRDAARVSHISRTLKSAFQKAAVAGVVLCQLSRALESREDKRPVLSDLRDSGSLEQDADFVVFVYRDEYYLQRATPPKEGSAKREAWDTEVIASRDRVELLGAKRRQGALVRKTGYFIASHQAIRPSGWSSMDDLFNRQDDDDPGFGKGMT